jgi:hypothetical protein
MIVFFSLFLTIDDVYGLYPRMSFSVYLHYNTVLESVQLYTIDQILYRV